MRRVSYARAAVPWTVVLASAVPGLLLVGLGLAFRHSESALSPVRMGLLLLAVPAAFLLDDPASGVSGATPRSPWWDLTCRLLPLAAGASVIAALTWLWDRATPTPQAWLLALVPICCGVAAVAGAGLMRRAGRVAPGDVVSSLTGFLLLGLLIFAPGRGEWELLPWPGSAGAAETGTWVALAAVAVLALVWSTARGPRTAVDR